MTVLIIYFTRKVHVSTSSLEIVIC